MPMNVPSPVPKEYAKSSQWLWLVITFSITNTVSPVIMIAKTEANQAKRADIER